MIDANTSQDLKIKAVLSHSAHNPPPTYDEALETLRIGFISLQSAIEEYYFRRDIALIKPIIDDSEAVLMSARLLLIAQVRGSIATMKDMSTP